MNPTLIRTSHIMGSKMVSELSPVSSYIIDMEGFRSARFIVAIGKVEEGHELLVVACSGDTIEEMVTQEDTVVAVTAGVTDQLIIIDLRMPGHRYIGIAAEVVSAVEGVSTHESSYSVIQSVIAEQYNPLKVIEEDPGTTTLTKLPTK